MKVETKCVTVHFKKRHMSGFLVGLVTDGQLTFVNRQRAIAWIEGIQRKHEYGLLPYQITMAVFNKAAD